jgi:type IV secretion system protein VirB1
MAVLTETAVLALALQCAPGLDPQMLVGIATHESRLRTDVVHQNPNGSHDVGLMQINSANFAWLGLTEASALDPCQSLRAARDLLQSYSRYNTGSPVSGVGNGYVRDVVASVARVRRAESAVTTASACTEPDSTGWRVSASNCRASSEWRFTKELER